MGLESVALGPDWEKLRQGEKGEEGADEVGSRRMWEISHR